MYGAYKIYSSWINAVKLGRQAANELQAAIKLGLQSSWAGIKLRRAGGADKLHRQSSWAATWLRSCASVEQAGGAESCIIMRVI